MSQLQIQNGEKSQMDNGNFLTSEVTLQEKYSHPWSPRGIGSRSPHRYQSLRMLKCLI